MVKFEVISRENIKPSSPTPSHLTSYKLSLLDRLTTPLHIPTAHLYTNDDGGCYTPSEISNQLKKSLSKILTCYYPLAGRFTPDKAYVDCNDEGAELIVATMECEISLLLEKPDDETLISLVFPGDYMWGDSGNGSLLAVQITTFICGGIAIGISMSHKVIDACSFGTFINDWSAINRKSCKQVSPYFISESVSVHRESHPNPTDMDIPELELRETQCVTRRFMFHASKIAELKNMAVIDSKGIKNPTRAEAVIALLYRCMSRTNLGSFRPSALIQMVNMRPKLLEPLPNNSIGNFCWCYTILASSESDLQLHSLVSKLREGLLKLDEDVKNMTANEWLVAASNEMNEVKTQLDNTTDVYRCSSLTRCSLYEADFGWGRPSLVRMATGVVKNTINLIDTSEGDGIDAWVTLEEQDMDILQLDKELLAFVSLDPNA